MSTNQPFWDDLARDLEDPEFLREHIVELMRIATVDAIVNELDEAREAAGLSKADLARAIQVEPATIRRLFAAERPNPTLGTLAEVAAALGLRITLEPLAKDARATVTKPLIRGKAGNASELAHHLEHYRTAKPQVPAYSVATQAPNRSSIARGVMTSTPGLSSACRSRSPDTNACT